MSTIPGLHEEKNAEKLTGMWDVDTLVQQRKLYIRKKYVQTKLNIEKNRRPLLNVCRKARRIVRVRV